MFLNQPSLDPVKYDNLAAFEKHLESSVSYPFPPVYLIMGKELVECTEAAEKLQHALLPIKGAQQLDRRSFDGSQIVKKDLLTEIHSIDFLTDKRVIWIQQADKLKKELTEVIEHYLDHPNPSLYLLLTASTLTKTTHFYKKIEKTGVVLEFAELKPWEKEKKLIEWVSKQSTLARKVIPYQVCQYLVKHSHCDQGLVKQELEKLLCFVGEKKEITLQEVMAICTNTQVETIWLLGEAIFRRDPSTAIQIARGLLESGQSFFPLVRNLRTQVQTHYQICTLLALGKQASDVTQEFPYMKGQILERHLQFARQHGLEKFRTSLLTIDAIELQAKNSQVDEIFLLDLLIAKLIAL